LRLQVRKIIPIARFGKLYGYKEIYSKVYIVYLDNGKIIRVRDVRFYEKGVFGGDIEEEALFEVVFNEKIEKFTFGIVYFKTTFGSSESPIL